MGLGLLTFTSAAHADPALDLENLSGSQLETMLKSGQVTSVQLVRAYEARIASSLFGAGVPGRWR